MNLEAELETFAETNRVRTGPKCAVCELDPEWRSLIESARGRGRPSSVIVAFLRSKGLDIKEHQIGNHTRKHVQ